MVVMFVYKDKDKNKMKYIWSNLGVLVILADFGVTFHSGSVFFLDVSLVYPIYLSIIQT